MSEKIYPLNVEPSSEQQPKNNENKPTFKDWFSARKRMFGLVLAVFLITIGIIIYPSLNLQLGKGQLGEDFYGEDNEALLVPKVTYDTNKIYRIGDTFEVEFEITNALLIAAYNAVSEDLNPDIGREKGFNVSIRNGDDVQEKFLKMNRHEKNFSTSFDLDKEGGYYMEISFNHDERFGDPNTEPVHIIWNNDNNSIITVLPKLDYSSQIINPDSREIFKFVPPPLGTTISEGESPITMDLTGTENDSEGESDGASEEDPTTAGDPSAAVPSDAPPSTNKLKLSSPTPSPRPVGTEIIYKLDVTDENGFKSGVCTIDYGDSTSETVGCEAGKTIEFKHTYDRAGKYTAKAEVKNKSSDTSLIARTESIIEFEILDIPKLTVTASNKNPVIMDETEGIEVSFEVKSTAINEQKIYNIDYGDKSSKDSKSSNLASNIFKHTYKKAGTYTVASNVTNNSGTELAKAEVTINVEVYKAPECKEGEALVEGKCTTIPANEKVKLSDVQITKNKFNPAINASKILYKLNRDAIVTIEILDTSKKTVVTLMDKSSKEAKNKAGDTVSHHVWFYGTVDNSADGQKLADGTYTYQIIAENKKYSTDKDIKSGTVIIDTKDEKPEDWEGGGTNKNESGSTTNAGTSGSSGNNSNTALNTSNNNQTNQEIITLHNNPPNDTSATGPGMLIYLIFPAVSSLLLTSKKTKK